MAKSTRSDNDILSKPGVIWTFAGLILFLLLLLALSG